MGLGRPFEPERPRPLIQRFAVLPEMLTMVFGNWDNQESRHLPKGGNSQCMQKTELCLKMQPLYLLLAWPATLSKTQPSHLA